MARKSYNPFKMWGAWVGTILLGIWYWVQIPNVINKPINQFFSFIRGDFAIEYLILGIYLIIGFLLGWGIHSIVRASRK
ncbi:MAG: hypothetical protein KKF56_05380 [Nanoarchaeota archaeon]|nr:hypothetical protein [Nanoarchaeota archaeon]